jgi:Carboxypeptidase regulatory-like domain
VTIYWPKLFAVLLLCCRYIPAQEPTTHHLRGIVRDSHSRQAVSGARVSAVGGRAKQDSHTDSKGFFDLPLMPEVQPGDQVWVRVEKEGYVTHDEAVGVSDVTLQIAIDPVSRPKQKASQKDADQTPIIAAPVNPDADSPKPNSRSDNLDVDPSQLAVEVRRRLPAVEFSFHTSGDKRQEIPFSVIPELIQLEPKPTGVKESDLPMEVSVPGGTVTVLRFGKGGDHGYILFDTRDVPKGTTIRGEIIGYKELTSEVEDNKAQQSPQTLISAPSGIAIGGGTVNNPTVNNTFSDRFPRPGVVPKVAMCVSDPEATKKVITIKTDTSISAPYWWFAFDGPVSEPSVELLDAKEPYGSTNGRLTPEQAATLNTTVDRVVGVQINAIGNPLGGPWRPLEPTDTVRITITSKQPVRIVNVEPGSQTQHLDEQIVFNCK